MSAGARSALAAALSATLTLFALTAQAELKVPDEDGWYAWETDAVGITACCYRHEGATTERGCNLDGHGLAPEADDDCDESAGQLRIYVRIENGEPSRMRALSSNCPVALATPAQDLGSIPRSESIAWLSDAIGKRPQLADDGIAGIALHGGHAAYVPLAAIVEDRSLERNMRETALFWLAQLESPEAASFLEHLLSGR